MKQSIFCLSVPPTQGVFYFNFFYLRPVNLSKPSCLTRPGHHHLCKRFGSSLGTLEAYWRIRITKRLDTDEDQLTVKLLSLTNSGRPEANLGVTATG